MATSVEAARQQWADGNRRLESHAAEPEVYGRLLALLEVATEELRKRVGETFTLAELAQVYDGADGWMREAVAERAAAPGWSRHLSLVQDAAFHLFARGATDYSP
jgi:transcriptional regulator of NAD metabolism